MTNLNLITNRISSKIILEMHEENIDEGILSSVGSAIGKAGKYIKDAGSDFSAGFKSGYYGQPIEKFQKQRQQEPDQETTITQNSDFFTKNKNLILKLIDNE